MVRHLRLTALLLSFFSIYFASVSLVYAQESRGMTIIPPKFELFGNPGDQLTEKIRIRNDSASPMTQEVFVEDFNAAGEEGQVSLDEGESNSPYSLSKWLELETKDVVLQPGEEKSFSFTINVPRNAEPGGHYASVLFQAGASAEPGSGTTGVSQRVGSLVLLRVSGNVVEKATIETFEAPQYSKQSPVNLTLRLKNEGNTHIRPQGVIIITNLMGKKVDEIPLEGLNALPGATRKMDTPWSRSNLLGYYTATMVATYGQQNLPLTAATKFFVASPTAIALISIGVIGGLIFIISMISGRKRLMRALKVIVSGK